MDNDQGSWRKSQFARSCSAPQKSPFGLLGRWEFFSAPLHKRAKLVASVANSSPLRGHKKTLRSCHTLSSWCWRCSKVKVTASQTFARLPTSRRQSILLRARTIAGVFSSCWHKLLEIWAEYCFHIHTIMSFMLIPC